MPVSELPTSRADDAARLVRAVQEAGAVALKFYKGPLKKWTKGEGDSPVTEADIAANEVMPGIAFHASQIVRITGVGQLVEVEDGFLVPAQPIEDEV